MNKKKLPKRKLRRVINIIIFLIFIFIVTIGILLLCSVTIFKKKQLILTPIGTIKNTVQTSNATMSSQVSNDMQNLLDQYHLSVDSITTGTDSAMHILFKGGQEIIFSENKEIKAQIASLQLIMNRLTIEGKQFSRIDLRFDNPVITF